MRKFLSVLLCFSMIFSMASIMLCSSASAEVGKASIKTYYPNNSSEPFVLLDLSFDQGTSGIPLYRYSNTPKYITDNSEEADNRVFSYGNKDGSAGSFWLGNCPADKPLSIVSVDCVDAAGSALEQELKNREKVFSELVYCKPGITYTLTFKYKFLKGTTVPQSGIKYVEMMAHPDPTLHSSEFTDYYLSDHADILNTDEYNEAVKFNLNGYEKTTSTDSYKEVLTNDTEWKDVTIEFKVKATETQAVAIGMRSSLLVKKVDSDDYEKTITNVCFDNFKLTSVFSYEAGSVIHDFEEAFTADDFDHFNTQGARYSVDPSDENNHVFKVTNVDDADDKVKYHARVSMKDGFTFQEDRLYYVSFKAKTDDTHCKDGKNILLTALGIPQNSGTAGGRYFISGTLYNNAGISFYVENENGEMVQIVKESTGTDSETPGDEGTEAQATEGSNGDAESGTEGDTEGDTEVTPPAEDDESQYLGNGGLNDKGILLSTEWTKYAIIIDTSNPLICKENRSAKDNDPSLNIKSWISDWSNVHFYFGVSNPNSLAYFDDLEIHLIDVDKFPESVAYGPRVTQAEPKVASVRYPSGSGANYVSAGLRFRGTITKEDKDNSSEMGFIIAPAIKAVTDPHWFRLEKNWGDGELPSFAKTAVCYSTDQKIDIMYRDLGDQIQYQMILTGLSTEQGATGYNARYTCVMYRKDKTDGLYYYYALGETSYSYIRAQYKLINYEPPEITKDDPGQDPDK